MFTEDARKKKRNGQCHINRYPPFAYKEDKESIMAEELQISMLQPDQEQIGPQMEA